MQPASFRQKLSWKDIFKADFWRYLLKPIWLFFLSILFLAMAWFCFWNLTQGKDLMQITLERPDIFAYFIIAQVCAMNRSLAYNKELKRLIAEIGK